MTIEDIEKIDPHTDIKTGYSKDFAVKRADEILKTGKITKSKKVYLTIEETIYAHISEVYTIFENEEDARIFGLLRSYWAPEGACDGILTFEEVRHIEDAINNIIVFETGSKFELKEFLDDNNLEIVGGYHFNRCGRDQVAHLL